MTCKSDNKTIFTEEQPYTQQCEACGFYVKIYSYRSCEARHKWNLERGNDVFAPLAALDRAAKQQLGISSAPIGIDISSSQSKKSTVKSRHRGRK